LKENYYTENDDVYVEFLFDIDVRVIRIIGHLPSINTDTTLDLA